MPDRPDGPDPIGLDPGAVLTVVDVQLAIDAPVWGRRGQTEAESNIAALLAAWRRRAWPIIHIRHDWTEPQSPYRPGQPGHAFKPEAMPLDGETVVAKRTNSAFIGTELGDRLSAGGNETLAVTGVLLENSVEATVRMAGRGRARADPLDPGRRVCGGRRHRRRAESRPVRAMTGLARMDRQQPGRERRV